MDELDEVDAIIIDFAKAFIKYPIISFRIPKNIKIFKEKVKGY